ncbi:uncharacterized protein LOC135100053 [Scylla paramamosain]|uniref:uncharacterized protein LOC135100053 n=1 Tax=Scylla paramamosain TaxID=85552 RepID=UPI003082D7C7
MDIISQVMIQIQRVPSSVYVTQTNLRMHAHNHYGDVARREHTPPPPTSGNHSSLPCFWRSTGKQDISDLLTLPPSAPSRISTRINDRERGADGLEWSHVCTRRDCSGGVRDVDTIINVINDATATRPRSAANGVLVLVSGARRPLEPRPPPTLTPLIDSSIRKHQRGLAPECSLSNLFVGSATPASSGLKC